MKGGRRVLAWSGLILAALVAPVGAPARAAEKRELVVFAAASLREAFEALVPAFEASHPGVKVRLNLAGSQELRVQIEQGARADVFASADLKHMGLLEQPGLVHRPSTFARNEPVIVVPKENPAKIRGLVELPRSKRLVVGAPEVPIGAYTVKIFDAAGKKYGGDLRARLDASVVSRELNARQVLAKVTLGEADAGVVYRTDARTARDEVQVITIPAELNVVAEYPIAVLRAAPQPALGRDWVALVLSRRGQETLAAAGFAAGGLRAARPKTPQRAPAP